MCALDINALQEENERLSDNNQSSDFLKNFVKMPEGKGSVVVRILPPAPKGAFDREKNPFYQPTKIHTLGNKRLHSLRELQNGRWVGDCPLNDYYSWLWKESETKDGEEANALQNRARAIKGVERYYYNVIVRKELDPETGEVAENVGPKILSVGKTLHKMIIRAIVGSEELDEDPLGDVTDVKAGRDFKIVKTLKGEYPDYSQSKFLDPSPLGDPDQVEQWVAEMHDLVALRRTGTVDEYKHALKVYLGIESDSESSFDPTEFDTGQVETTTSVTVTEETDTSTDVEEGEPAVVGAGTSDSDEAIADEDFMNELKNLA